MNSNLSLGEFLAFGSAFLFIGLAISIFMIICMWKVYVKAGKPGWAAIVPIYNIVVLLEIVKKPVWWLILLLIPIVNFIVIILIYVELAKAFGQGVGFALGLIFLSIIFFPILAFGDYQYVFDQPNSDEAILA